MDEEDSGSGGRDLGSTSTVTGTARPLLTPEPFSGKGSFTEWLQHFEGVAAINKWDDAAKLLWLRVRLVGSAQTAYGRLPTSARDAYANLTKALKERFEPDAMKELYVAEFQTRRKAKTEGWAEFADHLKLLADKAFPDLEDKARECMALAQYMGQVENAQVAFSVRQKRPTTLIEAVSATIEMESYLRPKPSHIAQVEPEQPKTDTVIAAVQLKQDAMLGMLENIMARLEKLEARTREGRQSPLENAEPRTRKPVVCRNCLQEGHYARGCASPPARTSKNYSKTPISLLPVSHAYRVNGRVNGGQASFVVDTGAAITLLDKTLWDKVNTAGQVLTPWTGPPLVGVEGTRLETWGASTAEISFAGETFRFPVLVASSLTADAILGLDFLDKNRCTLEMANKVLRFPDRGISVSLQDSSLEPHIVQARVTLEETLRIPPFSEMEVMAKVDGEIHEGTWLLEECKSRNLPVRVARALVSPVTTTVPVRLLNLSSETTVVFKGTKVATVEEYDTVPIGATNWTTTAEGRKRPVVSESKRQMLEKMAEKCADDLNDGQREQFSQLLLEYADIFAEDGELGRTNKIKHSIHTGDAQPIRQRVRRIPLCQRQEMQKLLMDMQSKDVIQPSQSPWASPVVLVQKKDGSTRFCIDYRKLNAVTRKDAYPIPRIDDTLDTLAGSRWFSTLDMVSGYWQVEVGEEDREKTAFCTPSGLFEFKVMPFGLCNGPATFQRLMDLVLAGLQMSHCLVYVDDVIVMGRSFQEHLHNLRQVFGRVREAGLTLKPTKCEFFQTKVFYLGHVIAREGISTDPAKIDKVAKWPTPQTERDVQQFLGLAGYYRRFVRDFATIAKPLHRLTEKTARFEWTPECHEAFQALRQGLCSAPILAFPNFTKPFVLDTDASNTGIGGVLSQLDEAGNERVVAYASRTLSKAERRYCVTRRELLAVVAFTQHFRPYLLGKHFVLRTDHGSLTWLQSFKEPEGQLARWLEKLQEYQFTIVHRQGKKHANADALSRLPCTQCGRESHQTMEPTMNVSCLSSALSSSVAAESNTDRDTARDLQKAQLSDPSTAFVLRAKEKECKPSADLTKAQSLETRKLLQQWDQLEVHRGILARRFEQEGIGVVHQWIVPPGQRKEILQQLHGGPMGAHLGEAKTLGKLRERFYWPGHGEDVKEWCSSCELCEQRKNPNPRNRAPLVSVHTGYPMQRVATDILGPLPETQSGNSYVLVVADYFTRWVEAFPIRNQEATTVAKKLVEEVFCRFSPPEQLHSDQGRQFESFLVAEVCRLLGIQKTRTTAYHPQSDGLVERWNRTLLHNLSTCVKDHPESWEDYVRAICMAYNTSVHATTGFTPFYLMFGRQAKLPVELMYGTPEPESLTSTEYANRLKSSLTEAYQSVRLRTARQLEHQAELYNQKLHGKPHGVGSHVWVLFPQVPRGKSKKLYRPWSGPFVVVKRLSDVTYRVQEVKNRRRRIVVHFNRLKRYTRDTTMHQQSRSEELRKGTETPEVSRRHYFGANLEVADDEDVQQVLPPSPRPRETGGNRGSGQDTEQLPQSRRYPQRVHRRPDRYT